LSSIKTFAEFSIERLHQLMSAASRDIARAVLPIYFATERGRPEHLGSCVLVKWKSRCLILTAAHVIDGNKVTSLYIPIQGKLQKLEGSGVATTAPGGIRDRDRFDFCVIDLPEQLADALGNVRYIQEHELAMQVHASGRAYMAFGFPNSKNKPDHGKRTVQPRRFSYGGPLFLSSEAADPQTSPVESHLLRMKYDRRSRTVEGEVVNSIEPRGISGGGLFDMGTILPAPEPHPCRLAGILIERRRKEKVIVATEIATIMSVLAEGSDQVGIRAASPT
jgi:hypothetical protein